MGFVSDSNAAKSREMRPVRHTRGTSPARTAPRWRPCAKERELAESLLTWGEPIRPPALRACRENHERSSGAKGALCLLCGEPSVLRSDVKGAMSQGRNPQGFVVSTSRRVIAGFLVAIVTLVVVSCVTLVGLTERSHNITAVERSFSALRAIEDLAGDVSGSQLALAEFLVTGDHRLLAPYEKARRSVPEILGRLRALTSDGAMATRQLDQLEPVLRAGLDRETSKIAAQRTGASIQELDPILMHGKGMLDRSAALLEDLKEDTAVRLHEEQRSLSESIRSATVVIVVGDAILLALILAAAALSMRDAAQKARAVEFQRRVLGMVGHDLRNPLSVISMSASQLARAGAHGDMANPWIGRISAAANRMDRLIRDLLDCSRLELGISLPLDIRRGDAHKSCLRILEDFRAIHPTREIQYHPGGAAEVEWDPDRIEQVLENLIGNALKYSPERTPVRVAWTRAEGAITIEVCNGGPPIPSSLLPHVFEPFQRGTHQDGSRAKKTGIGLGLYIVHQIVKQHGGTIDAFSSQQEGTKFTFTLPQSAPSATSTRRVGEPSHAPHDVC
jgi:signal transduction histidine kinase